MGNKETEMKYSAHCKNHMDELSYESIDRKKGGKKAQVLPQCLTVSKKETLNDG